MPFGLLHALKKGKLDKLKSKSKSTTDLYVGRTIMDMESDIFKPKRELKSKSKSKLQLFLNNNKNCSQVNSNNAKMNQENNVTSGDALVESKKTESANKHQRDKTETSLIINGDQNNNESPPTLRITQPKRSPSCCAIIDVTDNKRRMSLMVQLDQYIDYYKQRTTDDGINANRLLCAQLVRQGLVKLEQTHQTDPLPSRNKRDLSSSTSNLNQLSSSNNGSSPHFQKNKVNQRRQWSQWSLLTQQQDHGLTNQDSRRSSVCVDSDEDRPVQSVYKSGIDNDVANTVRNYRKGSSTEDMFTLRDFLKKPKFMSRRKSVPVLSPVDIEIY
uniref:Uncharacterized protein n=1 Tax=Arion vulgaris TaxID=1028688 RepID=A0A0B7BJP5_9EUPU